MKTTRGPIRLPAHDHETVAPVTIMDAEGRVVRVVPATEFQRPASVGHGHWLERRRRQTPTPSAGRPGPE
jgi:hypothetical protein